jgi:regulator of protease activity HflC (stomatin/prohibitin superfamily)
VRFTLVQEATAKAVVRLGAFKKILMSYKDYELDKEWNVKPVADIGKKWHLPGGLRFVGIWPLDKVYSYDFRWQGIEIVEGKEKVVFNERKLDYILVRPDVYWTQIKGAETVAPERIPLDIEWLITMRVVNPYKTLFKAPPNWVENILARLNAHLRDWVATKSLDEILALGKEPAKLLEELKNFNIDLFERVFKEEWGILLEGIQIRDIILPTPYREAAARRKQLELEAEAKKVQFEIEAKARAQEVMGTIIEALVAAGYKREDIEKEFQDDPKKFYEKHKTTIDNVMTKLSMEEGTYLRIETPGAEGTWLGDFLKLIGAWKNIPVGRNDPEHKKKPTITHKKKPTITEEDQKREEENLKRSIEKYFEKKKEEEKNKHK